MLTIKIFFTIVFCFVGKPIDNTPNRSPSSKWYVSYQVWPDKFYPQWFQGMIYFLTPRYADIMFQTALNTHYMHTDDVFIGIVVSKIPDLKPGIRNVNAISHYTDGGYDHQIRMKPYWRNSHAIFYHVPSSKLYMEWSLPDLQEKAVPWFQW